MPALTHNPLRTHQRIILAHHIIMTLYGHWPPNDPRGSGSIDFYDDKFEPLGPIYHGRKPPEEQPSREELRKYHKQVMPLLNFPIFWLNDATRQVVVEAIREVVRKHRYTCYACAICSNHLHLVIRKHRDSYEDMWAHLAKEQRPTCRVASSPTRDQRAPPNHLPAPLLSIPLHTRRHSRPHQLR